MINGKAILLISFVMLIGCRENKPKADSALLPIVIDGKFGAINRKGELVIPVKYEWLYYNEFGNGRIVVEKNKFKAVIDDDDRMIIDSIPYQYDVIVREKFISCITKDFKDTLIYNLEGLKVSKIDFKKKNGWKFFSCRPNRKSEKHKYRTEKYKELFGKDLFDASYFLDFGIALVITNERWGYIDMSGVFIWSTEIEGMKDYIRIGNGTESNLYEKDLEATSKLIEVYLNRLISDIDNNHPNWGNFRHSPDEVMWIVL